MGEFSKSDPKAPDGVIRCDALWCDESHPLDHDWLGRPSFETGRWLGWVYLDVNRPDLIDRPLRFCCGECLVWWIDNQTMLRPKRRQPSDMDLALREPADVMARRRVGLKGGAS